MDTHIIQTSALYANEIPPFPSGRFFKYPLAIVKKYGAHSRTLAALWSLQEVRQTGGTHAGLKHVSKFSGVPESTLKKQITALAKQGAIDRGRTVQVSQFVRKTRYRLTPEICDDFKAGAFLRAPIEWTAPFSETILKAYYFHRCGVWNDRHSYCLESFERIGKRLGIDPDYLGRLSAGLAKRGEIIRQPCQRYGPATYGVYIPGFEPSYPLREVLYGKRRQREANLSEFDREELLRVIMTEENRSEILRRTEGYSAEQVRNLVLAFQGLPTG